MLWVISYLKALNIRVVIVGCIKKSTIITVDMIRLIFIEDYLITSKETVSIGGVADCSISVTTEISASPLVTRFYWLSNGPPWDLILTGS